MPDVTTIQLNKRIIKKLKEVKDYPEQTYNALIEKLVETFKKMKGEKNVWRKRIGSYRLFYEIIQDENIIHVFHVERRTTTTY